MNVAARLESVTKLYGVDILASEETQAEAADLAWLEVDCVRVKGREAPTRLFALVGDDALAQSASFVALRKRHETMLAHYRARRFAEAAGEADGLAAERDQIAPLYRAFGDLARGGDRARERLEPGAHARQWSAVRILDSK